VNDDTTNTVDDRAGAILAPDTLLPTQYFDQVRRAAGRAGERRLMVAVLEDAVRQYLTHAGADDPHHRALFEDAEAWVEERDASWFYSFENVCTVLDLDPEYLRRGLRAHRSGAVGRVPTTVADDPDTVDETPPLRRASA
jgi:hypothetical protein